MNSEAKPVSFEFRCDAERVYLVSKPDGCAASVSEMSRSAADSWSLQLDLPPGVYRLRYYAGDAKQITYCGSALVEDSVLDGMDAQLKVLARHQEDVGEAIQSCA